MFVFMVLLPDKSIAMNSVEYLWYVEAERDTSAVSSQMDTDNIVSPEDPPQGKSTEKEVTIEDVDKVMSELVSKLPEEQRLTIRKSNGELYDYVSPLSKKIKKRKVVEIRKVKDASALGTALDSNDIPTERMQVLQYAGTDDDGTQDIISYVIDDDFGNKDENSYGNSTNFLDHFSIAVGASTTGFRLDYGATISRNVDFRLGFSYLDFDHDILVGVKDDQIRNATLGGYNPDLDFNADMKFYNLHALFDFYPMRNGIFHLTAGLFFGKNTIAVKGSLVDPQTGENAVLNPGLTTWPNLHYADYEIPVAADGSVSADIRTGKDWVKPYLGVGLGRSVPKGNFSFKLEAGLMYQGGYSIESNGTELRKAKDRADSFDDKYQKLMKWWPVVNLQLVYRFK